MNILGKEIPISIIREDNSECDVDIIIPSYKKREMATLAAKSFFKFETKLSMRIVFVDNSGSKEEFVGLDDIPYTFVSVPDEVFCLTKGAGKMSHSNAYALEVGRSFCTAPYVFVCHDDVLAYGKDWLSYLHSKMSNYKLAAFVRDNIRIKAAHVSGFMYDRKFYDEAGITFWPRNKPERDVGDDFSYYLQKHDMEYFVCPCSHNDSSLLKGIHKKYGKLRNITADKCLDNDNNVIYLHTGRGTVKMNGSYSKPGKTTYKQWLKFAKRIIG